MMYRYPESFARVNVRFGFRNGSKPKFIRLIRWTVITEMTLAALSAIGEVVASALGWK